eukprot:TRINITY_DN7794_c1_g3_i1.p5 TRINITY_DN7794_c1_g3~~TRINITY_DN7794_c1_g3_i1.p5  ORF type:complete len:115 (-),score=3.37 TRINITY_DN7794_c1_g3_i1:447-791(-)
MTLLRLLLQGFSFFFFFLFFRASATIQYFVRLQKIQNRLLYFAQKKKRDNDYQKKKIDDKLFVTDFKTQLHIKNIFIFIKQERNKNMKLLIADFQRNWAYIILYYYFLCEFFCF